MVIYSGNNNKVLSELMIGGEEVERVNEYKHLGTIIDNKLNFDANTCEIVKRCNQRMFCLYRLRSFDVARNTLQMFY